MNLYQTAKADNKKILNDGFSAVAKLTNSATNTTSQSIQIFYSDVGLGLDPENDMPIVARKIGLSFHMSDITIPLEKENLEGWQVEFTNNKGDEIKGVLKEIMQDRTLDMLTANIRIRKNDGC